MGKKKFTLQGWPKAADPTPAVGTPSKKFSAEVTARPMPPGLTVVGVGASAGGLEAFSQLLHAVPEKPGLAIVCVQHLAPRHVSVLPRLLARTTKLPVVQVTEGILLEADHVYVIPPNVQMSVQDGTLHLAPRPDDPSQYTPINFFFRSLAENLQGRAVGVILSGTGSDGAVGLHDIQAAGGVTIAQDPETAQFDGMPRAAIAKGVVDLILPAAQIGAELSRIARHPSLVATIGVAAPDEPEVPDADLLRIFGLLRSATGVDFAHYKPGTIRRRLQRRMALRKIAHLHDYLALLQENSGEVSQLYQDLLIDVTRFFREPGSFQSLAQNVLGKLLDERAADILLRVWTPGCSTGEEAYSLGIAIIEHLDRQGNHVPVQIFATDVSESAIEMARTGLYPSTIADDVSAERLWRFFTEVDGSYRISKSVRDLCVFARQDRTRDPPFSRLDLIVCRNVLIDLGAALQKKLIAVFHCALKANGFLMLGSAETTGADGGLFSVVDKKHRLYSKRVVETASAATSIWKPIGCS